MKYEEFLKDIAETKSKNTFKSYKRGIDLFVKCYGKDADVILKERHEDLQSTEKRVRTRFVREIEKFHKWLRETQKLSINSCRTTCLGIMQLFRYFDMTITLPTGSDVSKTVESLQDMELNPSIVRAMFLASPDLRAKVILSLGKDLAWRVGDFASITLEELPDLEQETPIPFDKVTGKENVVAHSFISKESTDLLKDYVKTLPENAKYLFQSNGNGYLDTENFTLILKDLAILGKIKIPKTKRLRFHCLRKLFISTAKNLGIDPDICKKLVGKSVKKDILAYMTSVDYKQAFIRIHEVLSITRATVEATEMTITSLKKQAQLEYIIEGLLEVYGNEILIKTIDHLKKEGKLKTLPISTQQDLKHGTIRNLTELLETIGKERKLKRELEYKKLLANNNNNGNGNNHETTTTKKLTKSIIQKSIIDKKLEKPK
jgi:integrase